MTGFIMASNSPKDGKKKSTGKAAPAGDYVLKLYSYENFLLIPIRPKRPEPRSKSEPGNGAGVYWHIPPWGMC
jgi:hypothetical protein